MKRNALFGILAIIAILTSCISKEKANDEMKIYQIFNSWAKINVQGKYIIKSVVFDTVGTPLDYMYKGYMLNQTVGSSGKTDSEYNIALNQIMLDCVIDSTFMTKEIIVAKITIDLNDKNKSYYLGMRGDSVCTTPKCNAYEALKETHHEGEQRMYEAVREIKTNLNTYVNSQSYIHINNNDSEKAFYDFWIKLPGYAESMRAIGKY